jgi:hypothetical protein
MNPVLARCGYRCDLCLAYQPNIEANPANREKLSDGWHRYFGFRIPPAGIYCEGSMEQEPRLVDQSCPVRPCVIDRGIENCAQCELYICEKLNERLVVFEDVQHKVGFEIPEHDRVCFIQPYENRLRLESLR